MTLFLLLAGGIAVLSAMNLPRRTSRVFHAI
jgi:hypothetical protein